jgi:nucleoside 2-deoxyribosyltransferase
MKIYFAGSITGGRDDKDLYFEIIKVLGNFGAVLTEHIGNADLSSQGETALGRTPEYIFSRDVKWVAEADVLVAELTVTSLGVGYEIGLAESLDKPILCLYRKAEGRHLSSMITGNRKLKVEYYQNVEELPAIFEKFFKEVK